MKLPKQVADQIEANQSEMLETLRTLIAFPALQRRSRKTAIHSESLAPMHCGLCCKKRSRWDFLLRILMIT